MRIVSLTNCKSVFLASLYKDRLENEGVRCFIPNQNFANLMPHYFGILNSGAHIMIDEKDYDKAVGILDLNKKRKLICPDCNSENIIQKPFKNGKMKIFIIIVSLLFAIPFGNINNSFYCKACERKFN